MIAASAGAAALEWLALLWWTWIAPVSIQVSLLALLVLLIEGLLPRRTWPELRAGLWILVMLKLALPPGLSSPLSWSRWVPEGLVPPPTLDLAGDGDGALAILVGKGVTGLWLLGFFGLVSLGLWRRMVLLRRWRRGATAEGPPGFASLLLRLSRQVGLRRAPRVLFSSAMRSPCVTGLPRPTIFLPATLIEDLSEESLEHVLLHELAHIRRLDLWVSELCLALHLVYWFHPLVWLAQRRLTALREQCCDRSVARLLGHATEGYRRTLLTLARRLLDDPLAGQLRFVRPERLLLARLRLLEHSGERTQLRRATTSMALALLLFCVLPMAKQAEAGSLAVAELIDKPPGCLQLRYLVLKRIADEDRRAGQGQPSGQEEERP